MRVRVCAFKNIKDLSFMFLISTYKTRRVLSLSFTLSFTFTFSFTFSFSFSFSLGVFLGFSKITPMGFFRGFYK